MAGNMSRTVFLFFLLTCLCLAGCAIVGRKVPADDRILFSKKESQRGKLHINGLTVHYSYDLKDATLNLTGKLSYQYSADSLDVYVWFLDGNGEVLRQKIIYSTGYRISDYHRDDDSQFQKALSIPSDAAGMTFSYASQLGRGTQ